MTHNHSQDEDLQLPALIDRAQRYLAEAKTSAELLQARAAAQAALHYSRLRDAAIEVQADCLRIIKFAELRLADEIDKGQERGEVAQRKDGGRPSKTSPKSGEVSKPATYKELNLDNRRVVEWRQLRSAGGEPLVEKVIQDALSEGRAPKASDIRNEVRKITLETRPPEVTHRDIVALKVAPPEVTHRDIVALKVPPPEVIERNITVVRLDPEETERHNLWWSVRHGIFSEQNTQPDPARAAIAVPADMRGWVAQQAKSHSRWLEKFVDRLLEEASETLPPAGEDARPH
jgi:hypothetical protein